MRRILAVLVLSVVLAGCGSKPAAPDWEVSAHDALQRYVQAYLRGDARVAGAEFERARKDVASTGQPGLVARVELTRCAMQVASLVLDPCTGFEGVRADAPPAERAYAAYLAGRIPPAEVPLLPEAHRAVAGGREDAAALEAISDPVARMVAAGVLMRSGKASPPVIAAAVETASQRGWRRPLLAWLGVQLQRAERAGAKSEADRIRRQIALVGGEG